MLAWVVMIGRHTRRPTPKSPFLHTAPAPTRSRCLCVKLSDFFPPTFLVVSHLPYLLPSSVSRNPFVCHSYENCRGVYQQFPLRNKFSPNKPKRHSSHSALFKCFLFRFLRTLLHFFALSRNSTLLLSGNSVLFVEKTTRGGGAHNTTVQLSAGGATNSSR